MDDYNFPRYATHSIYGDVRVYGIYQCENIEGGLYPQAIVEIVLTGKIEEVNCDDLIIVTMEDEK